MHHRKRTTAVLLVILVVGSTVAYVGGLALKSPQPQHNGSNATVLEQHTGSNPATVNSSVLEAAEYKRTLARIHDSERRTGGFVMFSRNRSTLYSTRFLLPAASQLGVKTDRDDVSTFLDTLLEREFSGDPALSSDDTTIAIVDYQHLVLVAEAANLSYDRIEIRRQLSAFKTAEGGYCNRIFRNNNTCVDGPTIAATYFAVTTLEHTGFPEGNNNSTTVAWLEREWNSTSTDDPRQLSRAGTTLTALSILYDETNQLPEYEQKRSEFDRATDHYHQALNTDRFTMFQLRGYYELLVGFELLDASEQELIDEYLSRNQLPNGGFSTLGGRKPTPRGAYIAVSVSGDQAFNTDALTQHVRYHNVAGGGYSLAHGRTQIDTTRYAVHTLSLFDRQPQNPSTIESRVRNTAQNSGTLSTEEKFDLLTIYSLLNSSTTKPLFDCESLPPVTNASSDLEQTYQAVTLRESSNCAYNQTVVRQKLAGAYNPDGGYGYNNTSSVVGTYYAIRLSQRTGIPIEHRNRTVSWIRNTRPSPKEGYRRTVGARQSPVPDVRTTYRSVFVLLALSSTPTEPEQLSAWVRSLETRTGGFENFQPRIGRSQAEIEHTRYALGTLGMLQNETELNVQQG